MTGKALSREKAITPFPAPKQVTIPLSQHIGAPCKPLVQVGDQVTVGQKLGDNTGLCVPVHAPVSGKSEKDRGPAAHERQQYARYRH